MTSHSAIRSPAGALVWEIWTAHRFGFLAIFAAIPLCAVVAHWVAAPPQNLPWAQFARLPFIGSALALFLFFSFTEPSSSEKLAVFPVRLFSLPVRTLTLVSVPMLSGAVLAGVLYVLWATLVFAPLEPAPPVFMPALLLSTGLMAHLAIIWGLPRLRLGRLFLSGGVGSVLIWELLFPDALLPAGLATATPAVRSLVESSVLGVLSMASFCAAWLAVSRQRHVQMRETSRATLPCPANPRPTRAQSPFTSPRQAQLWLEWRCHGWLFPMALLVLGLAAAGPVSTAVGLDAINSLKLVGWLSLTPLAMATLLGKVAAVPDFWSCEMVVPLFISLRPQSCGELVLARFRMAAISAALGLVVTAACITLVLGLRGNSSLLWQLWQAWALERSPTAQGLIGILGLVALFLLTWRQLVISLYVGLSGSSGLFAVAGITSFALWFVAGPWAINWALEHGVDYWEPLVPWRLVVALLTGLFLVKMFLAWWVWRLLYRRQALRAAQIAGYWLLWVLGTACLVALAELASPGFSWVRRSVTLLGFLALPIVRPGLALLTLEANRHQPSSAGIGLISLTPVRLLHLINKFRSHPLAGSEQNPSSSPLLGLGATAVGLSAVVVCLAVRLWDAVPHLVEAEGGQLRLLQLGQGRPTVVLESDVLSLIESWWPVQRELAQTVRVISYERSGRGGSSPMAFAMSPKTAARQLHAALLNAHAPPPYLLVGDGLGAALARVFASLYPSEVAALVLLDPPQGETSDEALAWLKQHRPEQLTQIQEWLTKFPVQVRGYGLREFKRAELKLDKLNPAAIPRVRSVLWDEVTDGTLYGMGVQLGGMAPGSAAEFEHTDQILLEDRAAWPALPRVPVVLVTGLKRGLRTSVERDSLDEELAAQKLARHREWLNRMPEARHITTLESGGKIAADQPELVVEAILSTLRVLKKS